MALENDRSTPLLSLVIPFYNESSCIDCVCSELHRVLSENSDTIPTWECILVDDGSQDLTGQMIEDWAARHAHFRAVHITPNSGQSAALQAGFQAARGLYIGTMDGDGQNDPRDLPLLLGELQRRHVDMMCGIRARRADSVIRRASSRIANGVRRTILQDGITDVGCAIRVFRRDCPAHVPFFRNAHRFFPALVMAAGFRVAETPVRHRPRLKGTSKYGTGINNRLWVGLADLAGVCWLRRRSLPYQISDTLKEEKPWMDISIF
jgi:dolichol-phosphate mannosyltransferase